VYILCILNGQVAFSKKKKKKIQGRGVDLSFGSRWDLNPGLVLL